MDNILKKNHFSPLYVQLSNILRKYIRSAKGKTAGRLPTEKELCRRFGVSRNTVSQALSMLAEENLICRIKRRGTILSSHLDLYDPQNSLRNIGVLFPEGDMWNTALKAMKLELEHFSLNFKFFQYRWHDLAHEKQQFKNVREKCAGVILYPNGDGTDLKIIEEVAASGYPLVLFDLYSSFLSCNTVSSDHFLGAYHLTNELIKAGCKKIGCVVPPQDCISIQLRHDGYLKAMKTTGIPFEPDLIFYSGTGDFMKYLDHAEPDGLFFCSQHPEFETIFRNKKMRGEFIKRKILITNFDPIPPDFDANRIVLASAIQHEADLGKSAILLLTGLLRDASVSPRRLIISPEIRINNPLMKEKT